ncbi:hypothetical protein [Priestia megaterium]|uniref:hypothetical protein n=1 Tax=Priestia megaterium TaxID=1404 RepID=UPI001DBB1C05|nr:hypothetical protein [Priestia megaterium]CAH0325441.1 hypothetical protein SRABI82_06042 [Priestia megaterium]
MKKFISLFVGLFCALSLTACFGETYDFTPPTVSLSNENRLDDIQLEEANVDWNSDKEYKKETKDILNFGAEQHQFIVGSNEKDSLVFDNQDFAVEDLNVSLWKRNKKTQLELKDDRSFTFPAEKGQYVIEVNLLTDSGSVQYVGNILIK